MISELRLVVDVEERGPLQWQPVPLRRDVAWTPFLAGLALVCLAGSSAAAFSSFKQPGSRQSEASQAFQLAPVVDDSSCSQYPYPRFATPDGVLYNNLGSKDGRGHLKHKGQQDSGEGIVYRVLNLGQDVSGEEHREVLMVVNCTNPDYYPGRHQVNGVEGQFGSISVMPKSELTKSRADLEFHFYDRGTGEKLTLPRLAFTFFDLATARNGSSTESVTIGGFSRYYLTNQTEVLVQNRSDGRLEFSATRFGDETDEPRDPMNLTRQQKSRAVTVVFKNLTRMQVTFSVTPGEKARTFLFAALPSLLCAQPYVPKWPNLKAIPPMERAVVVRGGERFDSFVVKTGDKVKVGDAIVTTKNSTASVTYRAPASGTVVALQDKLKRNVNLDSKLDNKTVVVIKLPFVEPLDASLPGEIGGGPGLAATLPAEAYFEKYLKEVGDSVNTGDAIAMAKDSQGSQVVVRSTTCGLVRQRQELIAEGDPIMKVRDRNLITLSKFRSLGPDTESEHRTAFATLGAVLVEYKVKVGDAVRDGDIVATTRAADMGLPHDVFAAYGGIITSLQPLQPGDSIDRVEDLNLAMVGKFPPLPLQGPQQVPTPFKESHVMFVQYEVRVGDFVDNRTVIARLVNERGYSESLVAPQTGSVIALQTDLKEGMMLHSVMTDTNLATIGKLPSLRLSDTEDGSFAPTTGDWLFEEWNVHIGDEVEEGQPVATLKSASDGTLRTVSAVHGGSVTQMQDHLRRGDLVSRVVQDGDLAVVGKFAEPSVGFMEVGVQAPDVTAVFEEWLVQGGAWVSAGDAIARVTSGAQPLGRRLAEPEYPTPIVKAFGGSDDVIPSPSAGWINYKPGLRQGVSVRDQLAGSTIAKIRLPWPWWSIAGTVLIGLLVLSVLGYCIFKGLEQRKPDYEFLRMQTRREDI